MSKYSYVYFDPNNQKVRWTQSISEDVIINYEYVGKMTRVEFDLLVEVLWEVFEDKDIPLKDFLKYYNDIRVFCDKLKVILDR
jgi:hypothetical protein